MHLKRATYLMGSAYLTARDECCKLLLLLLLLMVLSKLLLLLTAWEEAGHLRVVDQRRGWLLAYGK